MATLVRWEPFRELASLQSEMGRLFGGLAEGPLRTPQAWVPALDVWETEDDLVYAFDLPGIPEERISIEVADDTLTLSAEREKQSEESGEGFYRFERRYGTFSSCRRPATWRRRGEDLGRLQGRRARGAGTEAR